VPSSKAPKEETQLRIDEDKKKMQWRTPVNDIPGMWKTKFGLFAPDDSSANALSFIAQPIPEFSVKRIKKWY